MEYYQCPISLITEEVWVIIELILTQEETGIPVYGTCLLDQTPAMFRYREVILSERAHCHKEISKLEKNRNKNERDPKMDVSVPSSSIVKPGAGNPVRKFNVPVRPQKKPKKDIR